MSDTLTHMRISRDSSNVATVWFDVQNSPMNVFNAEVIAELGRVVGELERDPPKAVLFRSAKASGFFAGADIKQLQRIATPAEADQTLAAGQKLFDRVEALPCPTIAVIHGPCLGGGLEFALACKYRIARNDASTKLGLPEVQLGLIPGWGGTQRLPKLVGLRRALAMILEGGTLSAAKAAKAGLVDRLAAAATFDIEVVQFVDAPSHAGGGGIVGALLDGNGIGRSIVFKGARNRIGKKARHYPALSAALAAIEAGYKKSRDEGFATERAEFGKVLFTDAARSLIDVFFQREKARKPSTWVAGVVHRRVQKVAVIGGGTMGAGIAQLVASNGIAVVLKEVNADLAAAGKARVDALTRKAAEKGAMSAEQADALLSKVTATHEWPPVDGCDLAIEAVVEREDVKKAVFAELAGRLPGAILATNTSALSVTRIADATAGPARVAGLHFFNPVHRMQLVEVVRGKSTDDATLGTLVELVRKLGKVPVVVADSPGFLVNRVLFPYMDEAVRLVKEGYSVDAIDREAVRFGMPMGPLELLDTVGIDVSVDIAKTLGETGSPTPDFLAAMVEKGWKGKKSGHGFYEYKGDDRGTPSLFHEGEPRVIEPSDDLSEVQRRLIYPMVNEAARCIQEGIVGGAWAPEDAQVFEGVATLRKDLLAGAWAVDLAMVLGTGFAPFRGGPLKFADRRGIGRIVGEMEQLRSALGERFAPAEMLTRLSSEDGTFHGGSPRRAAVPQGVH